MDFLLGIKNLKAYSWLIVNINKPLFHFSTDVTPLVFLQFLALLV